ncbi:CatB-related O-acetyltransferase [Pseudoroseomonas wenyumeiae]
MVAVDVEQFLELSKLSNIVFASVKPGNNFPMTAGASFEGPCYFEGLPWDASSVGAYTIVRHGVRLTKVRMGRFCSIGPNVQFGSPEHPTDWIGTSSIFVTDYDWTRPVRGFNPVRGGMKYHGNTVGNDVWVGRGAFIKAGVTIGDGAIIGAQAVVTKDVKPYEIVAGNPARVIRNRFDDETISRLLSVKWWDYEPAWMSRVDFKNVLASLDYLENNHEQLSKMTPPRITFGSSIQTFGIEGVKAAPSSWPAASLPERSTSG